VDPSSNQAASTCAGRPDPDHRTPKPTTLRQRVTAPGGKSGGQKEKLACTILALDLFRQFGLQLLIVTPLQKIHVIEPYVSAVGFVDNKTGASSRLQTLTIEEYREQRAAIHHYFRMQRPMCAPPPSRPTVARELIKWRK
jgi:hypothetical protein